MKGKLFYLLQICILAVALVCVFGCTLSAPPVISVSADSVAIEAVTNKTAWDDETGGDEEIFDMIMGNHNPSELPFVAVDEEITVQFFSGLPDSILLNEYIISVEEGKVRADNVKEVSYRYKRKKAFFVIEPLESVPAHKELLRGYKMVCRFSGGNECEYNFIIRSAKLYNIPSLEPVTDFANPNITFIKYDSNYAAGNRLIVFNDSANLQSYKAGLTKRRDAGYEHLAQQLSLYGDEFFDSFSLVFAFNEEPSSSLSYRADKTYIKDGRLIVAIKRMVPYQGDDALAYWATFAIMPKDVLQDYSVELEFTTHQQVAPDNVAPQTAPQTAP